MSNLSFKSILGNSRKEMNSPKMQSINGTQFRLVVSLYGNITANGIDFTTRVVLESSLGDIIVIDNSKVKTLVMEINSDGELRMQINRMNIFHEVDNLYVYYNGMDMLNNTQNPHYRMFRDDTELFRETLTDLCKRSTIQSTELTITTE